MAARGRRITGEKKTIMVMLQMYCRDHHGTKGEKFCPDCRELWEYAQGRLDKCPFGPDKPTCRKCPTHCYRPIMRKRVHSVMGYSGRRMLRRHPVLGLRHLVDAWKRPPEKPKS